MDIHGFATGTFRRLTLPLLALCLALAGGQAWAGSDEARLDAEQARAWVEEMKASERGPFERLRWFCEDGTTLPPEPYACAGHGGGHQHGERNDKAEALRQAGLEVATVLAGINVKDFLARPDFAAALKQMILERWLVAADDGWIYRRARFYRGALQAEDEDAGGKALLLGLLDQRDWRQDSFLVAREAVRALPHGRWNAPLTDARALAARIEAQDSGFAGLRAKLHGAPGPEDTQLVREHALQKGSLALLVEYERLAMLLQDVYKPRELRKALEAVAGKTGDAGLAQVLRADSAGLGQDAGPAERMARAARAMSALRSGFEAFPTPEARLAALDLSLGLEAEAYALLGELLRSRHAATRAEQLRWLDATATALHGMGLLGERELEALRASKAGLDQDRVALTEYRQALKHQERAADWAARALHFHFAPEVERFAAVEPKARLFTQDRLRASPLALHAAVCETLLADADRNLGLAHTLLGRPVSSGLRGLNPGLARGVLHVHEEGEALGKLDPEGIHLLPATTSDLPPVAGILTMGLGNSLSHVQLLARDLGIPNAAVDHGLLGRLSAMAGKRVVLAVSPGGRVSLEPDSPTWDAAFDKKEQTPADFLIPADTSRLDLRVTSLIPLGHLAAGDAGRVAGPKACNLGELKHAFPEAVSEGLVIPFGVYAQVLDRPARPGGPSMREFLRQGYALARGMHDKAARAKAETELLAEARAWFESLDLGPELTDRLRAAMDERFGPDGTYGVFVRSDTNVEDLPGFTGAGLNKTVPNVVGFDEIIDAIRQVWASPFSERAYAWRQAHMEDPAGLHVSVLIQKTVPADKSGVLVTTDIHAGRSGHVSIAVNEGLGGAVDGQLAEELCVELATGRAQLLAPAGEPLRRAALPEGGLDTLPCSGGPVLAQAEIAALCDLARTAPARFRALRGQGGQPLPADMEFGFVDGRLALFQLRPFVTSAKARRNALLLAMDEGLKAPPSARVDLRRAP